MTFIEDVLSGDARLDDVDDYVERWHTAPRESPIAKMQLHEYLGLTRDEYGKWVEQSAYMKSIVAKYGSRE